MIRILCVGNLFPNPYQPGKGIFNLRQWSELGKHVEVRVVSPVLWTDDWRGRRRGETTCPYGKHWNDWLGLPVAWCRYWYTPRILRHYYGPFFEASVRRTFEWAVADFRPDLVIASFAYPDGWAVCRLAKKHALPVIVKIHGSDLLVLNEYWGRKRRTIEALRGADCLLTVSRQLRDRAIQLGIPAEKIQSMYEGTDCDLFAPGDRLTARTELGLPLDGQRLLFIGNLVPVKGVPHLLDACHQLTKRGVMVTADILGDGPLRKTLQRHIDALKLGERVRLRGWRPPQELVQWYRASDLVVLPSYSEGVPNVLVEAAATGTPFVATAVGGIPEIADLAPSRLVPPGDAGALADAIDDMLAGPCRSPVVRNPNVPSIADGVLAKLSLFRDVVAAARRHQPWSAASEPAHEWGSDTAPTVVPAVDS